MLHFKNMTNNNQKYNNNNGLNNYLSGLRGRVAFFIFLFVRPFILTVFIAMVIYAMSNCLDISVMVLALDPLLFCTLIPIKSYSNTETEKAKILSDNKKKSGIYM
jgi:hypothetical protein